MEDRKIYEDIALRTEGDIYIGVVGPGPDRKIHIYQAVHGDYGAARYGESLQAGARTG